MEALNLFGKILYFLIGAFTGACIMYFGGLIIDREEERR